MKTIDDQVSIQSGGLPDPNANPFANNPYTQNMQKKLEYYQKNKPHNYGQIKWLQNNLNNALSGKKADGSPIAPEWQSLIDNQTGMLRSEYTLGDKVKNIDLDTRAMDQIRKEALRDPSQASAWANIMQQQNQSNRTKEMDQATQSQMGAQSQAYDQLAAQGGLGSGSRERLARGGMRDLMLGRQGINQNAGNQSLNIMGQDEQRRNEMLKFMPSLDFQKSQFDMENQKRWNGLEKE